MISTTILRLRPVRPEDSIPATRPTTATGITSHMPQPKKGSSAGSISTAANRPIRIEMALSMAHHVVRTAALASGLLLAACSEAPTSAPPAQRDPAIAAAIADPIMTDTELAIQSDEIDVTGGMPAPLVNEAEAR